MNTFLQVWILLSSASAIFLLTCRDGRARRAGCFIGLLGQPAWIATSAEAGQWGVVILSCWFTLSYARGLAQFRHGNRKSQIANRK